MSRAATSFVIAYHGCDRETGEKVLRGEERLIAEDRDYHWLGPGIYFWENDLQRALEWAREKQQRRELKDPFAIGAVINLGHCLDLHVRENIPLLRNAYENLKAVRARAGFSEMPKNLPARKDPREDNVLRYLDCAVIRTLHTLAETPFDTVRGLFIEGDPVYPGAKIYEKTHSEIAVCNTACIVGVFLPV